MSFDIISVEPKKEELDEKELDALTALSVVREYLRAKASFTFEVNITHDRNGYHVKLAFDSQDEVEEYWTKMRCLHSNFALKQTQGLPDRGFIIDCRKLFGKNEQFLVQSPLEGLDALLWNGLYEFKTNNENGYEILVNEWLEVLRRNLRDFVQSENLQIVFKLIEGNTEKIMKTNEDWSKDFKQCTFLEKRSDSMNSISVTNCGTAINPHSFISELSDEESIF